MAKAKKKRAQGPGGEIPGITLPKTPLISSFCFYAVLLLLGGAGAMGSFFTAFHLSPDWKLLFFVMTVCALLGASHVFFLKRRWLFWLLPLPVWGLLFHHWFDSVQTGFLYTVNTVFQAYNEKLSLSLPVLSSASASAGDLTAFALLLQFPFFWLLAFLWGRLQSSLSAFALTGFFLLIPMVPSILPDDWALGSLLLYWGFLLVFSSSLRSHYRFGKARHSLGGTFARISSLSFLGVLFLLMAAIYRLYPLEVYSRPDFANDIRSEITGGMEFPELIKLGQKSGGSRVELSDLGDRSFTGKTAFQVMHAWEVAPPEEEDSPTARKEYLKSFAGSVYTGVSWERLDPQNKGPEDALGDRHGQTLLSEIAETIPLPWADSPCSYTLSVKSADGSGIPPYQPYGLSAFEPLPDHVAYQGDESLKAVGLFTRLTEYRLSARALPPEEGQINYDERVDGFLNRSTGSYIVPAIDGEDGASSRIDSYIISAAEGENRFYIVSSSGEKQPVDAIRIGGDLSGDAAELAEALKRYEEFVQEQYTQVPDTLRPFLESFLQEAGLSGLRPEDPLDCARQVRDLLQEYCSYTLSPPALPRGRDFTEYFLAESRRGYCVHFATAATLLLRAAGIPARYAEGYAVPVGENNQWYNVPDYNAHAWVELYLGGTGWVPFEVTPAGPEAPAAYRNAISPDDSALPTPVPTPTPTPLPQSSQPTPTAAPTPAFSTPSPGAAQRPHSQEDQDRPATLFGVELTAENLPALFRVLSPVLIPLLLLLLLWTNRFVHLRCRRFLFHRSSRNRAGLSVYSHLLWLYRAAAGLPGWDDAPPERITELALRARFSQHTLSRQELSELTDYAARLEKKLAAELPAPRRLFCKYLLGLF